MPNNLNYHRGKKRKRVTSLLDDETREKELYKLVKSVLITIRKEAKLAKAHETQKVVRKLKNEQDGTAKAQKLELRLGSIKQLDILDVIEDCMKQLGLRILGVDIEDVLQKERTKISQMLEKSKQRNQSDDLKTSPESIPSEEKNTSDVLRLILSHKKVSGAMEGLQQKVTEFRRDLLRAQGEAIPNAPQTDDKPTHAYGPGAMMEADLEEKKNRPGQRARRAKLAAQRAKDSGQQYESLNWRPKRQKTKSDNDNTSTEPISKKSKEIHAAEVARVGKNWKEEGKEHPSWLAKQSAKQQSGIATFQGTKITF